MFSISFTFAFNGSFKGPFDTCNSEKEFNLDERVVNALHNKFMNVHSCKLPFFGGNIYNLTQFCQGVAGGFQILFHLARYESQPHLSLFVFVKGSSDKFEKLCENRESRQEYCTNAYLYNITQGRKKQNGPKHRQSKEFENGLIQ